MIKRLTKTRKGFTLLEVMLSSVLMMVALGGVVVFTSVAIRGYVSTKAEQRSVEAARQAIEEIAKAVRMSSGIRSLNAKELCLEQSQFISDGCYEIDADGIQRYNKNGRSMGYLVYRVPAEVSIAGGFEPVGQLTKDDGSTDIKAVRIKILVKFTRTGFLSGEGTRSTVVESVVSLRDYDPLDVIY